MLKLFVNIVLSSTYRIDGGTLFCNSINVIDDTIVDCIKFLETKNILENTNYENKKGEIIDLEFSLSKLNSIGFYEDCEIFIIKNKYQQPESIYYILELKAYNNEASVFFTQYKNVVDFIQCIKGIAKHTYSDTDIDISIIFREDKSIIFPLIYDYNSIKVLNSGAVETITSLTTLFSENNTEKKLLFVNELIDYLSPQDQNNRFHFLLNNIQDFYSKGENAYQFYLRDFSYNKLKIELDSKALEFTQKIQNVINDSQTKLIAIPTAFVLAFVNLDFTNWISTKNIGMIISLFLFSILIQIFLDNQISTLGFIKENISAYKETFKDNEIGKISNRFKLVDLEYKKQQTRFLIVEIILWAVPIVLFLIWFINLLMSLNLEYCRNNCCF